VTVNPRSARTGQDFQPCVAQVVRPTSQSKVSVLVVNFRTPEFTAVAVESALAQPNAHEIIIVDNASGDGSFKYLTERFLDQPKVTIIEAPANKGFGAGNNLAAKSASCDFLFLLNSDATFKSNALAKLLDFRTTVGERCIVAPEVVTGSLQMQQVDSFGSFPTSRRILTQQTKRNRASLTPDWVSGCAFLIDRSLFNEVGGFDERIFMYFEDVLLCWHIRQLGCQVHRNLNARVEHLGGCSYKSRATSKSDYFTSQDIFLVLINDPPLLRAVIRGLRNILLPIRRQINARLANSARTGNVFSPPLDEVSVNPDSAKLDRGIEAK
jgi:N-acetylglucosaminyl-diphospho-decaprenol L-rhamnosyltransferase